MAETYFTLSKSSNIILRARKVKSGYSLFLDIHYQGTREHRYLNIIVSSIVKSEMTAMDKQKMKVAENRKSAVAIELNNATYEGLSGRSRIMLYDYLDVQLKEKKAIGDSGGKYRSAIKRMKQYFPANTRLSGLNKQNIEGYKEYLISNLAPGTATLYLSMLGTYLRRAYRDGFITHNPFDMVDKSIPRAEKAPRTFLLLDELKLLEHAYCHPRVKNAFLFCCYTGLRFSDVKALTWVQIQPEAERVYLYYRQQKTNKTERMPLAKQAIKYLPKRRKDTDKVFDLPTHSTMRYHLAAWEKAAGLKKHISFHSSRHTFATLALTVGVDLKTVSTLLGHSEIRTTEIYAKIIDKKKEDAVDMLPGTGV